MATRNANVKKEESSTSKKSAKDTTEHNSAEELYKAITNKVIEVLTKYDSDGIRDFNIEKWVATLIYDNKDKYDVNMIDGLLDRSLVLKYMADIDQEEKTKVLKDYKISFSSDDGKYSRTITILKITLDEFNQISQSINEVLSSFQRNKFAGISDKYEFVRPAEKVDKAEKSSEEEATLCDSCEIKDECAIMYRGAPKGFNNCPITEIFFESEDPFSTALVSGADLESLCPGCTDMGECVCWNEF